ncbi:histone-lysine N-methyltransferase eggless [Uranotaenia lowii]|uniref:histone-lysine N-methyltransferase eggless n=1 Tax=Uranotaenia lowii TaxID=190385 RepID=UPI002479732F|nr:histone-lysine N-methyltransferase eggless [Uranotaenia lowii]
MESEKDTSESVVTDEPATASATLESTSEGISQIDNDVSEAIASDSKEHFDDVFSPTKRKMPKVITVLDDSGEEADLMEVTEQNEGKAFPNTDAEVVTAEIDVSQDPVDDELSKTSGVSNKTTIEEEETKFSRTSKDGNEPLIIAVEESVLLVSSDVAEPTEEGTRDDANSNKDNKPSHRNVNDPHEEEMQNMPNKTIVSESRKDNISSTESLKNLTEDKACNLTENQEMKDTYRVETHSSSLEETNQEDLHNEKDNIDQIEEITTGSIQTQSVIESNDDSKEVSTEKSKETITISDRTVELSVEKKSQVLKSTTSETSDTIDKTENLETQKQISDDESQSSEIILIDDSQGTTENDDHGKQEGLEKETIEEKKEDLALPESSPKTSEDKPKINKIGAINTDNVVLKDIHTNEESKSETISNEPISEEPNGKAKQSKDDIILIEDGSGSGENHRLDSQDKIVMKESTETIEDKPIEEDNKTESALVPKNSTENKITSDDEDVVMIGDDTHITEENTNNTPLTEKSSISEVNKEKNNDIYETHEKLSKEEEMQIDEPIAVKLNENEQALGEKKEASKKSPKKIIMLDEKSGNFEEIECPPEESVVPQLITGDSDEEVIMIGSSRPKKTNERNGSKTQSKAAPTAAVMKSAPVATEKLDPKSNKTTPKTVSVDCVNPECQRESSQSAPAPLFILNFYGVPKKNKRQRICLTCYDESIQKYEELCGVVEDHRPLLFSDMPRKNELVEISDSSEEEEDEETKKESEKPLSADIISLVESELNSILTSTFEKINITQQIDWTEQIMKQKIAYNAKLSDEINNELNELQRKVDKIHLQLYSKSRPRFQELPPCNIFHEVDLRNQPATVGQTQTSSSRQASSPQKPASASLGPKKEEFHRPAIVVGQFFFAVKHKLLSNWAECQVVEAVSVAEKTLYKVNFMISTATGTAPIKVVPAKYLAYRHSFNVKLPLGTRVIARFDAGTTLLSAKQSSQQSKTTSYYPGIIAESFGKYNLHRYLIFFDDGYAQYVNHGDVRVVCEESKEVWEDIHPHSQEFIRNYLLNYRSQRPMVQVKVGQKIITEWKGKWIYAKVVDIDASLVQLHFPDDNRYEWIYRGSTRLGPLYQEKALSMSKQNNKFSKFQKRNEPSIEYITLDDDDDEDQNKQDAKKTTTTQEQNDQQQQQNKYISHQQINQQTNDNSIRSVAKKSTFSRSLPQPQTQPSAVFMNSSTIYCEDDRPKGKIVYYTAKKHLPPLKYKPHDCNPSCLFKITHNLKSYSPLAKPLLSGWERQLCKMRYKKVFVVYRAPCGRRLRNMYELHLYLRMTQALLNVENFDFDPMVHCLAEYVIENHIYHNPDLSDGKEYMAVPCVNYFDDTKPPPCIYSTERIPTEGVNLNLDPNFLCGCDCEDDCLDKTRCQCWQLTIAGAKFGNPNTPVDNIGYVYKRLQEAVLTGIYECNANCRCKSNCLNRVVQHPLQTKLQVFKTSNRGWGIRCLNDVPKGSFICIYSGHLLTEEAGNNICQMNENKAGDEYFADLDYIETVEQLKEGYETDVVESESENDSDGPDYDAKKDLSDGSDEDFTGKVKTTNQVIKTRSQLLRSDSSKDDSKGSETQKQKKHKKKDENRTGSDDEREMVSLVPTLEMNKEDDSNGLAKFRSVRKMMGKHEAIYIMDAKKSGNLGRYFNHSCNPNLFVQNVFVDTHDLRFPWVAFFALSNIRAGCELTWNYNYDVGSVPGKVLYCQCGAENCRQRLL